MRCAIAGCDDKRSPRHRFPDPTKHLSLYMAWVRATRNDKLSMFSPISVVRKARICDRHFDKQIKMINNCKVRLAVPTLFLPPKKTKTANAKVTKEEKITEEVIVIEDEKDEKELETDAKEHRKTEEAIVTDDEKKEKTPPAISKAKRKNGKLKRTAETNNSRFGNSISYSNCKTYPAKKQRVALTDTAVKRTNGVKKLSKGDSKKKMPGKVDINKQIVEAMEKCAFNYFGSTAGAEEKTPTDGKNTTKKSTKTSSKVLNGKTDQLKKQQISVPNLDEINKQSSMEIYAIRDFGVTKIKEKIPSNILKCLLNNKYTEEDLGELETKKTYVAKSPRNTIHDGKCSAISGCLCGMHEHDIGYPEGCNDSNDEKNEDNVIQENPIEISFIKDEISIEDLVIKEESPECMEEGWSARIPLPDVVSINAEDYKIDKVNEELKETIGAPADKVIEEMEETKDQTIECNEYNQSESLKTTFEYNLLQKKYDALKKDRDMLISELVNQRMKVKVLENRIYQINKNLHLAVKPKDVSKKGKVRKPRRKNVEKSY